MFNLTLQNEQGDALHFVASSPFAITNFEGLDPADATVNTSETALMDGAKFNSSKVNMRTINLAFAIEGDAERNRLEIYKVLKTKHFVRLIYKSELRHVFIDGVVQFLHIDFFAVKQIATVTILCPFPYLKNVEESIAELTQIETLFHFPFASPAIGTIVFGAINALTSLEITNTGSIETGIVISLYAQKPIVNPRVWNYVTGEYIGVNYSMQEGDEIIIDTRQGSKTITLIRNAVATNIFNYLMNGSKWLQFPPGTTVFTYDVGTGNASDLTIAIKYNALYEGV